MIGATDKVIQCMTAEVNALQARPPERDKRNFADLMELYAGTAKATLFSTQYGFNAVEPFDKNEGKNLTEPAQSRLVEHAIQQLRPLLLLVGFPCTLWNFLNENCNYYHRMEELEAMRELQRPLLRWICQQIKKQAERGNYLIFESSQRCHIWDEACGAELSELPGAQVVVADAGAFGAVDLDGFPIIKTHKFILNNSNMA